MIDPAPPPVGLACDMTAIPPTQRAAHHQLTRRLVAAAIGVRESTEGLALQLSADDYDAAVQFVAWERLPTPLRG